MATGNPALSTFPDTPFGAEPPPGLVCAFRVRPDGLAEELNVEQPIHSSPSAFLWLHFNLANASACVWLEKLNWLPQQAIHLLVAKIDHQQLDACGDCVYGVIADLTRVLGGISEQVGLLNFVMTENCLITGRRTALNAVEATRQALRGGRRAASVAALFELIVEHVAAAIDRLADRLAVDMDKIEERILDGATAEERKRLGVFRRTTVRTHRQLAGLLTLFPRADERAQNELPPALRIDAERLSQRLEGIDHAIEALRERARVLQEEISNQLAEETNRHLRALSFVTILFLPPTLIAGFFGMNLKGLPFVESDFGFWSGLLAAAMSSVCVYMLLRWFGVK